MSNSKKKNKGGNIYEDDVFIFMCGYILIIIVLLYIRVKLKQYGIPFSDKIDNILILIAIIVYILYIYKKNINSGPFKNGIIFGALFLILYRLILYEILKVIFNEPSSDDIFYEFMRGIINKDTTADASVWLLIGSGIMFSIAYSFDWIRI